MRLVQDGELRLDEPLAAVLPAFAETDKRALTIEHLLSHTSGLPDYRPWYRELAAVASWERRPRLQALLRAEPLAYPPGERALYSDLDFMLLGWAVEAVSGRRLDRFLDDAVYAPLGLTSVFFVDLQQPRPAGAFAATERCDWRGRVVEAEVHDEHAHALSWSMRGGEGSCCASPPSSPLTRPAAACCPSAKTPARCSAAPPAPSWPSAP